MDDRSYEAKMIALIAEAAPARYRKREITSETRLQQDLGLDSIGTLALLFRFEQAFEIDLAMIDIGTNLGQLRTVGDALTLGRDVLKRSRAAASA